MNGSNDSNEAAGLRARVRAAGGFGLAFLLALPCAAAPARPQGPVITPPPPPVENFVRYTEPELLAKLTEQERAVVERETDPRDRYEALLDVSEMRLAAIESGLDAGKRPLAPSLLLYEAVLLAADARLRSPEANVRPRDKRYKQLERRLNKHLSTLKAIVASLPYEDSATGDAVVETVTRLRFAALNSALDVDILETE